MLSAIKKLSLLTLATLSINGFAQSSIQLGHPSTGGTGCPGGSATASLSPDGSALSIIFDSFVTEAGPSSGRTLDRKNCTISIPVHVPGGYSVSVIGIDYRGFVSLPQGAQASMTAEYFFAGMMGPRFRQDFRGRMDQDYIFNNKIGVQAAVWSPCGADVNLRVSAAMMVRNTTYQDAMATVDSADISAGIIYQLQMRRCY